MKTGWATGGAKLSVGGAPAPPGPPCTAATVRYPLTSVQNFTGVVSEELLHRGVKTKMCSKIERCHVRVSHLLRSFLFIACGLFRSHYTPLLAYIIKQVNKHNYIILSCPQATLTNATIASDCQTLSGQTPAGDQPEQGIGGYGGQDFAVAYPLVRLVSGGGVGKCCILSQPSWLLSTHSGFWRGNACPFNADRVSFYYRRRR